MCAIHPTGGSDPEVGCLACWYRSREADIDRREHTPAVPSLRDVLDERDPPYIDIYEPPPAYEHTPRSPLAAKVMANYWAREMSYRAQVSKRHRKSR